MLKRKVIIVGGGLAGLSAAYELSLAEGFDVHVIEKSSVLGGRVQSCVINEQGIDMGGFLIYPWYKRYHELINELGLSGELSKVPSVSDYYGIKQDSEFEYRDGFSLSFKQMIQIFFEVFPNQLIDLDPTEPELHAYDDLSIQGFINKMNIADEDKELYLNVFDTYLQGYCYGPVSEHKMAFMAATLFQNIRHGDVHAASYLRNGSQVFIDAMKEALVKRGVTIHFNCALQSVDNKQLITTQGEMTADDILFCHTPGEVRYTQFITVTISFSGTALIDSDGNWGACFYKEETGQIFPVLSVVNLEKLYTEKTSGYFNLNIKVNKPELAPIPSAELLEIVKTEMQKHFKDITVLEIVKRIDWQNTMPVVSEDFVESLRQKQGIDNLYYGGDLMGCPSMETALISGKRAAEILIQKKEE